MPSSPICAILTISLMPALRREVSWNSQPNPEVQVRQCDICANKREGCLRPPLLMVTPCWWSLCRSRKRLICPMAAIVSVSSGWGVHLRPYIPLAVLHGRRAVVSRRSFLDYAIWAPVVTSIYNYQSTNLNQTQLEFTVVISTDRDWPWLWVELGSKKPRVSSLHSESRMRMDHILAAHLKSLEEPGVAMPRNFVCSDISAISGSI